MIKHIGKHDQKKAVILFKEVPNEDHMCLIVYPDTLPRLYHDAVMTTLESAVGQNAESVADPLGRHLMDDGRNCLEALHKEGFIRKVPNNQVVITPNANSTIRLDELNKILKEMAAGDGAKEKMAELDAKAGMQTKQPPKESPVNDGDRLMTDIEAGIATVTDEGVLTDAGIAQDQLTQAQNMRADAERLIAEAINLETEAYTMAPELKPKTRKPRGPNKKAAVKKATVKKTATKRGANVKSTVKN